MSLWEAKAEVDALLGDTVTVTVGGEPVTVNVTTELRTVEHPGGITTALGGMTDTDDQIAVRCYAYTGTSIEEAWELLAALMVEVDRLLTNAPRSSWVEPAFIPELQSLVAKTVVSVGREDF